MTLWSIKDQTSHVMNKKPLPVLSYATPTRRVGRFDCLRVMLPFAVGCVIGAVAIGWIVCWAVGGVIAGIADAPGDRDAAFGMWLFVATLASPMLLGASFIVILVRASLSRFPLERRRWWMAGLTGGACVCVPIALGIRRVNESSSFPWHHVSVNDAALLLAALAVINAPVLLVRRPVQ
jgi:hypothetical protein